MGGEMPIPYMTIRAYAADNGITGDDFHLFRLFLGILDAEWLEQVSERETNSAEAAKAKG